MKQGDLKKPPCFVFVLETNQALRLASLILAFLPRKPLR